MKNSTPIRFVLLAAAAHTVPYLLAGGISYQFVTKGLWAGPAPLLSAYLRTPGNEELWNFAMIWQIPGQLLRGFLMGLVLLPLRETLGGWPFRRTMFFSSALFFVFTHFSASAPSPANIEGLVYVRPEFVQQGFWKMQVEMVLYSLAAGILLSRFVFRSDNGAKNPPSVTAA